MKLLLSTLTFFLVSDVAASICLPPPENVENHAKYLTSQADVVFYGVPKSTTSEITDESGEICFHWVTEYSSIELVKGEEKAVVTTVGPFCYEPMSTRQGRAETKLFKTTKFETSLLAFTKKDEAYRTSNCLLEIYKSIGDAKFRKQLGLPSANKPIQPTSKTSTD